MPSTDSEMLRCRWPLVFALVLLGNGGQVVASDVQSPVRVADQVPEPSGLFGSWSLSAGWLETGVCGSGQACGKLIELQAFSGKMLDAAPLDADGAGVVTDQEAFSTGTGFVDGLPGRAGVSSHQPPKIVSAPGGASSSLEQRSSGGSRRILWRQIQ